jgi:hypothetical protein
VFNDLVGTVLVSLVWLVRLVTLARVIIGKAAILQYLTEHPYALLVLTSTFFPVSASSSASLT